MALDRRSRINGDIYKYMGWYGRLQRVGTPSVIISIPFSVQIAELPVVAVQKLSMAREQKVKHKRSRAGCYTCRIRHKKCSEERSKCQECSKLGLQCGYKQPSWWKNAWEKDQVKARIKECITRRLKKRSGQDDSDSELDNIVAASRPRPEEQAYIEYDNIDVASRPWPGGQAYLEEFDNIVVAQRPRSQAHLENIPLASQRTGGCTGYFQQSQALVPYEATAVSQEQTFIDSVELTPNLGLLLQQGPDWSEESQALVPSQATAVTQQQALIDQALLTPNWENLLHLGPYWPTLPPPYDTEMYTYGGGHMQIECTNTTQAIQSGWNCMSTIDPLLLQQPICIADEAPASSSYTHYLTFLHQTVLPKVLPAKCVERCHEVVYDNLGIAYGWLPFAISHYRAVELEAVEQVDIDFRWYCDLRESVQQQDSSTALDSILGTMFLESLLGSQGSVLTMWQEQFVHAGNIFEQSGLLEEAFCWAQGTSPLGPIGLAPVTAEPRASHTLAWMAWFDIIPAAMLGQPPRFQTLWRTMFQRRLSVGLLEMTGCDDDIVLFMSEMAAFEQERHSSQPDWSTLSLTMTKLAQMLNTMDEEEAQGWGEVSCVTAIFRIAVRIFLCSLTPSLAFDDIAVGICNLGSAGAGLRTKTQAMRVLGQQLAARMLSLPQEVVVDRSLAWPLLVSGAMAERGSLLRTTIQQRASHPNICDGAAGRAYQALAEIWRSNDEAAEEGIQGAPPGMWWRDTIRDSANHMLLA